MPIIHVKPALRSNTFGDDCPISKSLKIFFYCLQSMFSLDFGFVAYKSLGHKIFIRLCSTIISVSITIIWFIDIINKNTPFKPIVWFTKYLIENYAHIFILTLTPKSKSFYMFLKNLHSVDTNLGVDSKSYRLDIKIIICCFAFLLIKISCAVVNIKLGNMNFSISSGACLLCYLSLGYPIVMFNFVFLAPRPRLRILRDHVTNNRFEPRYCQHLYKVLIDSTENVKCAFDSTFIVGVFVNIPTIMISVYQLLKEIKHDVMINASSHVFEGISTVLSAIVILSPAIAADSLSSEVEGIKIILHDKLFEENDQTKSQDIQRFINYIEARPFKFYVLKIIPMNAHLPVKIFSFCVTYFIIAVQLTHLY